MRIDVMLDPNHSPQAVTELHPHRILKLPGSLNKLCGGRASILIGEHLVPALR